MLEMLKGSDQVTLKDVIDPDAYAANTYTTGWHLASDFHQWLALISVGDMVANSTVDAKFEQATSGAGAGAKDVTGAAITQLTQAGTDDNKQVLINLEPGKLDVANDFDYIRLSVTVAVAASDAAAYLFGLNARYGPGTHKATVDQVLTV